MNRIILFVIATFLTGCSDNNNFYFGPTGGGASAARTVTQYIHLVVGDSLGYDGPHNRVANPKVYTVVQGKELFQGKEYFKVTTYLLTEAPRNLLMKEEKNGEVKVVGYIYSAGSNDSLETTLYNTAAEVGSHWNFYFQGTIQCTMESRSDTVVTTYGVFHNCLRIRLSYDWYYAEEHWLAPGVGLVKKLEIDYRVLTTFLPTADLHDLRLKTQQDYRIPVR